MKEKKIRTPAQPAGNRPMHDVSGEIMLFAAFIVIASASLAAGKEINYSVRALMYAYVSGEAYSRWKCGKGRIYAFLAAAACITAILALIEVISRMFG